MKKYEVKGMVLRLRIENIILLGLITIFVLLVNITPVRAWKISFFISVKNNPEIAKSVLKAGMEPDATDGIDRIWDVSSFPPLPGQMKQLQAYFIIPSDNSTKLMRDIRNINDKRAIWDMHIESIPPDGDVQMEWSISDPSDIHGVLLLKDMEIGTTIDLLKVSEYKFSTSKGVRTFQILYTKESPSDSRSGSGLGCGITGGPGQGKPTSNIQSILASILVLLSPLMLRYVWRIHVQRYIS